MTDSSDFSPPFSPAKRKGLGRGLASLFEGEVSEETQAPSPGVTNELIYLSPEVIQTGQYQPRLSFKPEELEELAQSIREKGVLQPLLIRRQEHGFELIAGERRLRASIIASLAQVPCRVLEISPHEAFEVALLENIQRSDLSPIEEAKGYRQLLDTYGYTQETLAQKLGKSRTHMTNMLRLLTLPEAIQAWLEQGKLTVGHARALIGAQDAIHLARFIQENHLSVRETENLVRPKEVPPAAHASPKGASPDHTFSSEMLSEEAALARHLSDLTGLTVKIQVKPTGGTVQISFKTPLELDAFLENLSRGYLPPASMPSHETYEQEEV